VVGRGADITFSVVSHGQNALVNALLEDVERFCPKRMKVIVTENIADPTPLRSGVKIVRNAVAKGFGANHNAAFGDCGTPYFCVVNPDIRLTCDPFPQLLTAFHSPTCGVVGPLVRAPSGAVEDSARRFPTVSSLLRKALTGRSGPDYPTGDGPVEVDWVAGMFMLFESSAYKAVGGFDERYFLYYEDVDICRRLSLSGKKVLYYPDVVVVHAARRGSRSNPRLAGHHAASLVRFLIRART